LCAAARPAESLAARRHERDGDRQGRIEENFFHHYGLFSVCNREYLAKTRFTEV